MHRLDRSSIQPNDRDCQNDDRDRLNEIDQKLHLSGPGTVTKSAATGWSVQTSVFAVLIEWPVEIHYVDKALNLVTGEPVWTECLLLSQALT
jgi:hypothetical protein